MALREVWTGLGVPVRLSSLTASLSGSTREVQPRRARSGCAPPRRAVVYVLWGLRHERPVQGRRAPRYAGRPARKGGSMPADYELYVGIDWGTEQHHVCFIDAGGHGGAVIDRTRRRPGPLLVSELARRVAAPSDRDHWNPPRGALIDALLAHGCHVFAIQSEATGSVSRPPTVAGAKDDRRERVWPTPCG